MHDAHIQYLLDRHGLISDQVDRRELAVILQALSRSLAVDGAVVEFGCYRGTTSLYIRRLLDHFKDGREFHVYDSFEGLPVKAAQDQSPAGEQFQAGELAASKKQFIHEFQKAHLALPQIHKGWFSELAAEAVPSPIAFAFLDGDYYESIMSSLKLIEAKLAPGATIIIDDYANEALPGAARATDDWCRATGRRVRVMHSLAIVHC
ncbi:MAG: hypothetical protein JWN38_1024 [Candidatus Saccharibacteria bacterium]|nr:hypothetical protein [Candidatus Saccharibacteria bacterium]